ncbi:MAG: hypothetical protein AAF670_03470 [Planctomycetota bacterium]
MAEWEVYGEFAKPSHMFFAFTARPIAKGVRIPPKSSDTQASGGGAPPCPPVHHSNSSRVIAMPSTSSLLLPDPGYFLIVGLSAAYACLAFILLHTWLSSRGAAKERRRLAELHFKQVKAEKVRKQDDSLATPADLQALRAEMGTWTELLSRTAKQTRAAKLEREHLRFRVESLELELQSLKSPQPTFIAPAQPAMSELESTTYRGAIHLYDPVDSEPAATVDSEPASSTRSESDGQVDRQWGLIYSSRPDDSDDLTRIWGIGQVNQTRLNEMGVYCFHQIARWSPDVVDAFNGLLGFKGRIEREDWIAQAERLLVEDDRQVA